MLVLKFDIKPKAKAAYFQLKKLFSGDRVKFVSLDNMFLLLRYLPEVDVELISDINRIIAPIINQTPKLELEIDGVDIYPYKINPKVLWFRLKHNETLTNLAKNLDKKLVEFGFSPETFEFYPHITFARIRQIKNKGKIDIVESKFQQIEPEIYTFDKVIMLENIKTTGQNTYKVRNKFSLNN